MHNRLIKDELFSKNSLGLFSLNTNLFNLFILSFSFLNLFLFSTFFKGFFRLIALPVISDNNKSFGVFHLKLI